MLSHLDLLREVIPLIHHTREMGNPDRCRELALRAIDLAREAQHAAAGRAVSYALVYASRSMQGYARELELCPPSKRAEEGCYYAALAYLDTARDAIAFGIGDTSALPLKFSLI